MAFAFKSFKKTGRAKTKFAMVTFDALSDWKRIVYIVLSLFVAVVLWSGYLFWTIQSGLGLPQSGGATSPKNVKDITRGLKEIGEIYDRKGGSFELFLTSPPAVVDPSK